MQFHHKDRFHYTTSIERPCTSIFNGHFNFSWPRQPPYKVKCILFGGSTAYRGRQSSSVSLVMGGCGYSYVASQLNLYQSLSIITGGGGGGGGGLVICYIFGDSS